MILKPSIPCTLLFVSVLLFSFKNINNPADRKSPQIIQKEHRLDTGRIVNQDSIQSCITNYKKLMKNHGFSNPGGQPFTSTITTTAQLTTGESFSGTDLRDWLDATAAAYAQAGKTFSLRVVFGAYDMTYLNTYEPDPAQRTKKLNRIAIFLVPYDASSGLTLQPHANIAGGTPSGGGGSYDFGGLQP
ncbi:MAG TPA: hypothetical protein VFE04_11375 [Puia sp.]|jgi:hypothetical protein|nr:hypothetical protein [Puia sp.]